MASTRTRRATPVIAASNTASATPVTGPTGDRTVSTYGVVYNDNEGQLLKTDVYTGSTLLRSSTTTYLSNATAPQQAFADRMGVSPQIRLDSFSSERQRPKLSFAKMQGT